MSRTLSDAKLGRGKLDLTLVPPAAIEAIARALEFGAQKYSRTGYDRTPNAEHVYYQALRRHLQQFESGEDLDPETGLHHLAHAAANISILLKFLASGRDVGGWRDE